MEKVTHFGEMLSLKVILMILSTYSTVGSYVTLESKAPSLGNHKNIVKFI